MHEPSVPPIRAISQHITLNPLRPLPSHFLDPPHQRPINQHTLTQQLIRELQRDGVVPIVQDLRDGRGDLVALVERDGGVAEGGGGRG